MEKKDNILQGVWYRIVYVFLLAVAAVMERGNIQDRKSYDEFRSGMRKHEHDFEDVPYEKTVHKYTVTHWHACKHKGCNLVHARTYMTEEGYRFEKEFWKDRSSGKKFETFEEYLEDHHEKYPEPHFPGVKIATN